MKWWRICVLTMLCCFSAAISSLAGDTAKIQSVDPSVQMKNLDAYYITSGSTYDKITALLQSIPADKTGLDTNY